MRSENGSGGAAGIRHPSDSTFDRCRSAQPAAGAGAKAAVGLTSGRAAADTQGVDPWTLAFLVGGVLLIGSEFIAPSLFTIFLGVAALLTAALRGVGLVDSVPISFLLWSVISLGLVVPFRPLAQRFMPGGKAEVKKDRTDVEHDRDAMGEVVDVVEDVAEDHDNGRIRFQGTTWNARMTNGSLKKGEKAQLVYREGSIWVVEAVAADGAGRDLFGVDAVAEAKATVDAKKS